MEGLLASIGLKLFDKTLGWIIQPLREIFLRRRSQHLVRRASGRKIGILIARIDGDTLNGSLRETIRETIRRELGDAIEIVSWPTSLVIDDGHEQDSEQGAYLKAQSWLTSKNCDLLVWGRIKGTNVVSLRFTLANIGSVRAETYKLTETFDLPIEFLVRLGSALAVRILSMTLPAAKESGKYLVPAMREIASRLEPLIQHPNATLNKSALGALFESYALARKTIGEQTTSPDDLVVALTFYRAAGNEYSREHEPLAWAMTQNNIGLTLWSLGRYQGGDEPFREAIVAYHDALEAITTQSYPQEWALIQNNLGLALWASGERRNDAIQLEQAVTAFRQSLTYCKQEQSPLQWARIQNNLGSTLAILGDREVGVQRLNEAVAAFREALKQRQRNLVPLDWAMTQSNLALALRKLGERESNSALLCEAVTSCHEALTEFTRDRAPLDWARVKICLGNVLFTIGKIETGSNRLKDAVRKYRQALEEYSTTNSSLEAVMLQHNLCSTLSLIAQREGDRKSIEDAVSAYREASAGSIRETKPFIWAVSQVNLGLALIALSEQKDGTIELEEAIRGFHAAIEILEKGQALSQLRMHAFTLHMLRHFVLDGYDSARQVRTFALYA